MLSHTRMQPALLVVALLMSAAPEARAESLAGQEPPQASELNRLQKLAQLLVQPVLSSPDPLELEAAIEDQMVSGVMGDLYSRQLESLIQSPLQPSQVQERLSAPLERLALNMDEVEEALELTILSSQLARIIGAELPDEFRGGQAIRIELEELLYDDSAPLELREAMHAELQANICMLALIHASAQPAEYPQWLLQKLLEGWSDGLKKSVPLARALADELGETPEEFSEFLHDKQLENGMSSVSLRDIEQRSQRLDEAVDAIVRHARRQPDGTC